MELIVLGAVVLLGGLAAVLYIAFRGKRDD
jgi:hypothetical protein